MEMFRNTTRINVKAGETLFHSNDPLEKVYLIVKGQAKIDHNLINLNLDAGAIVGIMDICAGKYLFDYAARTDMTVLSIPMRDETGIYDLFHMGKNYQELAMTSLISQLSILMQIYQDKFAQFVEVPDNKNNAQVDSLGKIELDTWNYLKTIENMGKSLYHQFFMGDEIIPYMHIRMGASFAKQVCKVIEQLINVYGYDTFAVQETKLSQPAVQNEKKDTAAKSDKEDKAVKKAKAAKENMDPGTENLVEQILGASNNKTLVDKYLKECHDEKMETVPALALEEMRDALDKILEYSKIDLLELHKIKADINKYRSLPDRTSSDNDVRKLRKEISEAFYNVYEKVFLRAAHEGNQSRLIEMFLTFGFMDERDFTPDQMEELYYFKQDNESKYQIFTIYDWLMAIYNGEREPSKSELDVDYKENLRELKRTRNFTQQEENSYLTDQDGKVSFEIHNIMRTTSKITSGAVSIFCPILNGKQLTQNVKQMFLSAQRIENALDQLIDVDYSIFYREQMYYDAANKIDNILVMKQVLPDVILMPTTGSRGIMWQEISEKKRDTPARFVLPEFLIGNVDDIMIPIVAAFRWEMCRTIQGNYWNDIRDHSLTSEYSDYVQFYKKNKDLSDEVKEKVYAQLKSCRNSSKEMFVKDYEAWIKYESKGSLRLNKAVRKILFMYCPFSQKYRESIQKQPVYEEAGARFSKQRNTKVRELKSFNTNVLKRNGKITDVLEENLAFYESM